MHQNRESEQLPEPSESAQIESTSVQLLRRIPVIFLSGFLGSGKSTLLNEVLLDPSFQDTAVIINEFGDIAVDHLLVRQGKTSIAQVSTGCLCCSGGTDIRATLFDLHCAASNGLAPRFSRVIVEMSGLGDPAPLINALMPDQHGTDTLRDRTVDDSFYLAGFNTLFDIVTGEISIERYFEALKQVAFADRIILTKTDLAKDPASIAEVKALPKLLRSLNAAATIIDKKDAIISKLFEARPYSAIDQGEDVVGWLALESVLAAEESKHSSADESLNAPMRHGSGIRSFALTHEGLISEKQLERFLSILRESAGQKLLRVKGIVGISEDPDRPRIVHAVQHAVSNPTILDNWPDDDHSTRVVFIMDSVEPEPVRRLFDAVIRKNDALGPKQMAGITSLMQRSVLNVGALLGSITRKLRNSESS